MSIEDIYKKETGKDSKDSKRKGFLTEEYVAWLKNYVKTSDDLAPKLFRGYIKKDNEKLDDYKTA